MWQYSLISFFPLQRYSIALQTVLLMAPPGVTVQWRQSSKTMIFQMKRLKLLLLLLVEKRPRVAFKEHEKSIVKNVIEKLTFSSILSVKNQPSITFKGR